VTGYKLVNSLTDLQNVSLDLAGNYALGKDIDASATILSSATPPPASTSSRLAAQRPRSRASSTAWDM
jgi:hypothetical protein